VAAVAQSGTNSPYSQYGLGVLSDQSQGFSRGMNGVGLALRKGNIVNTLNPASYSAIDSLTMIFDVGLSGQLTNFKEGAASVNAKNANFEYAVGSFRLMRNVGMSFGVLPLTNVGYTYNSYTTLEENRGTIAETYSGSGGLPNLCRWDSMPSMCGAIASVIFSAALARISIPWKRTTRFQSRVIISTWVSNGSRRLKIMMRLCWVLLSVWAIN